MFPRISCTITKLEFGSSAVRRAGAARQRDEDFMSGRKVVITCAVTGSIHTPSMSPHLPCTASEIAEAAIGAAEAGAAIVHLHARDPQDGRPDQSPERFASFLKVIKQRSDCVVDITTGGASTMTIEERLRPVVEFKPEVASLNMGSMNFGLYPMLEGFRDFKHAWERPYLEGSRDRIFKNTFADIERILATCADNRTRFEIECYDIGHLYTLAHFVDRGLVKAPFFVQSVFGILGGIGPHPEDVHHMRRTADRLFGADYRWWVLGAGRNQFAIAAQSIVLGGNIRVGLEDSLWIGPGRLSASNAKQVVKARRSIEELGLEIATPDDARAILQPRAATRSRSNANVRGNSDRVDQTFLGRQGLRGAQSPLRRHAAVTGVRGQRADQSMGRLLAVSPRRRRRSGFVAVRESLRGSRRPHDRDRRRQGDRARVDGFLHHRAERSARGHQSRQSRLQDARRDAVPAGRVTRALQTTVISESNS
jgi:uncharacterized protein (DUF849 family)